MGSQGGEDMQQGGNRQMGQSTFACGQTRRSNWGVRQTVQPRVLMWGNKASKPQAIKTSVGWGENPSLTGESIGGAHRSLQCIQTYPPRNQHQGSP